jgi:hypothetical protein
MAEAERLSSEKRRAQLERENLQIDVKHRENVVTDKQVIADSLLRFESVVRSLPPKEQKGLVQMMVREISVKHFDPNVGQEPDESGAFSTKIRTKLLLVNVSLFASDLLPKDWNSGEISSDLKKIGFAGAGKIRTCWDLTVTVGIPFSRWGAAPFIVEPIPFPTKDAGTMALPAEFESLSVVISPMQLTRGLPGCTY